MPRLRTTTALLLISATLLTTGCSREKEKLRESMDEVEKQVAEGTAEAKKALAAARKRWDELRPEAERALASLENRFEKLVDDKEALKRLPPEALEQIRTHLDAMRAKLAEAKAAYEQGNADLAVEKADAAQQESAAVEELLVERPDPPDQGPEVR